MDLREIACGCMDWTYLILDRKCCRAHVNMVMKNIKKFLSRCRNCGISRRALFHGVSQIVQAYFMKEMN
jgi:hypothetical protein